jgi:hypothetical protein
MYIVLPVYSCIPIFGEVGGYYFEKNVVEAKNKYPIHY